MTSDDQMVSSTKHFFDWEACTIHIITDHFISNALNVQFLLFSIILSSKGYKDQYASLSHEIEMNHNEMIND